MSNLTDDEVATKLRTVVEAGRQAGDSRVQELNQQATNNNGQPAREECGNAMPLVKLDGRSRLARAIKKNSAETGLSISRMSSTTHRGYFAVHAHPDIQGDEKVDPQNGSIREKAAEAMAESFEKEFGIETTVLYWRN
nr:hypothetical protein [Achromobacter ruhlandii]